MSRAKQRENRRTKAYETKMGIREEKLDLVDYCGIKDPTPYLAVKNIIRRERASSTDRVNTATRAPSLAGTNA